MQQVRERVLALAGRVVASYKLERVITSSSAYVMYVGRLVGKKPEPITRPGLPPLLLPELALVDLIPLQERRAERAAELRRRLSDLQQLSHPGILPLVECGDDPVSGCIYAIYPYPSAGSLANRLESAKGKPLPFPEVTAYLDEVAGALDSAHQRGYFHLHLTPDTILLDASGTAYVAGMGIAQILELQNSIAEGSLYAAPEQVVHDPAGPTTDVYSLGMVLYRLLTGHTAFDSTRQQLQAPPPPSQYRPDFPAQIETVILRAISSYPAQRYATAGFLSHDFALAVKNSDSKSVARGIHQDAGQSDRQGAPKVVSPGSDEEPTLKVAPPAAPAPASPPQPPANKSFVFSSPPPTGNTLYPPHQAPQWELPPKLAQQLATTQVMEAAGGEKMSSAKGKNKSTRKKGRSWGIRLVTSLIGLVCVAIVAVVLFPQLNRQIALPSISLPGHSGSSTSTPAIGSGSFSASAGARLYEAPAPGICDKGGATWTQNSESVETCSASAMLLNAATCQNCPLAVVTFGGLPRHAAYPVSYAAEVTVQPLATDPIVMFGLKFRQQSLQDTGLQRGGYGFLVSQNGQWEFDKYGPDGSRQQIAEGKLPSSLPPNSALGLVVNGSTYYFYINGKKIATESDSTYSGGYLCLVAAPSATILFSHFSLAQLL
jgi:serine/threonine protein kinase